MGENFVNKVTGKKFIFKIYKYLIDLDIKQNKKKTIENEQKM